MKLKVIHLTDLTYRTNITKSFFLRLGTSGIYRVTEKYCIASIIWRSILLCPAVSDKSVVFTSNKNCAHSLSLLYH